MKAALLPLKILMLTFLLIAAVRYSSFPIIISPAIPTPAPVPGCSPSGFSHIRLEGSGLLSLGKEDRRDLFSAADKCVISNQATIPQFAILNYGEMKSLYYDQAKNTSGTLTSTFTRGSLDSGSNLDNITLDGTTDHLYHVEGDFNVSDVNTDLDTDPNPEGTRTGVFFIDGDLIISNNLTYGTETSGLVFIVQGNVKVLSTVTEVHAFIITQGTFCTSLESETSNCGTNAPLGATPISQNRTNDYIIADSRVYKNRQITLEWGIQSPSDNSIRIFRDGVTDPIDWVYPIDGNCSSTPPTTPTPTPIPPSTSNNGKCYYRMPKIAGNYTIHLYSGEKPLASKSVTVLDSNINLTIYGSVISLDPKLPPQFVRDVGGDISGSNPSEIVRYQPKYLVILKDIFSRELSIWREI